MGYTAVNISDDQFDQSGFESRQDAMRYIEALVCVNCINDVRRGYYDLEVDDIKDRIEVEDVLSTECGAVWMIMTDEEYESCESIPDFFITQDMTPEDRKTWDSLTEEQRQKILKQAKQKSDDE